MSAQTFCTQGGEIIPPRVARSVARHVPEMAEWAALGEIGRKRRGTVDAKTQERLVMELLGVYMRDGYVSLCSAEDATTDHPRASTAKQTAALLNAQSVHLDVLEVSSPTGQSDQRADRTGVGTRTSRVATRCSLVVFQALSTSTTTRQSHRRDSKSDFGRSEHGGLSRLSFS